MNLVTNTQALIDALKSVLPQTDEKLSLHEPEFAGNEWEYVKSCIDDGWVSSVGAFVDRFEKDLAERVGVKHAVATVNGTAALHGALMAMSVGEGDEVLVPTLTFIATANAVQYTGAISHFVDCEPTRLGIDAQKLALYLEDIAIRDGDGDGGPVYRNKHTGRVLKAIIPMHVFGIPADMDPLNDIAKRYGMIVIEDAAESLGSSYKGRNAGALGHVGAISFNGNKIITTGGGGAIVTNDSDMAARVRHLCTTAKRPHKWDYEHDAVGYNYRMPNINAALGCAQLEQLDGMIARKKTLAEAYARAIDGVSGVEVICVPEDSVANYWLNAIVLHDGVTMEDRNRVLQDLTDAGLLCRPVWNLMHTLEIYSNHPRMDLSCAENMSMRVINIPSSARLAGSGVGGAHA